MGRKFLKKGEKATKFQLVFEPSRAQDGEDENTVEEHRPNTRTLLPVSEGKKPRQPHAGLEDVVWTTAKTADHEARRQMEKDMEFYFPRDGYDYDKHLRTIGGGVFVPATEVKPEPERPSNLDKVHEQVYEAMDFGIEGGYEEFDEDDDILGMLGGEQKPPEKKKHDYDPLLDDPLYGSDDELDSDDERLDRTARANQDLQDVLAEYDDNQIGDLHREDIAGEVEGEYLEQVIDEFVEIQKEYDEEDKRIFANKLPATGIEFYSDDEDLGAPDSHLIFPERDQWDCESILSTKSNLTNHPGKIGRPKRQARPPKEKKPVEVIEEDEEDAVVLPEVQTFRPKDETAEQKKERKSAVKEAKRICRQLKKTNKEMYKKAEMQLNAVEANNRALAGKRIVPL